MTRPTLSVVLPNYNHARYLPESLGAILAQSWHPQEVIVVDDASTDNSVEVVLEIAQRDPIVRLVRHEKNVGGVASINHGVALASGEYVHCAAADDRVLPGFYQQSIDLLSRYPQAGLCSSLSLAMDDEGKELPDYYQLPSIAKSACYLPPQYVLNLLRRNDPWFIGNTVIHRRSALLAAGGFRAELGSFTDGFVYQFEALTFGACFIPRALGVVRILPTSLSAASRQDGNQSLELAERAAALMRTEYSSVFPSDYVDHFLQWAHYSAATTEILQLRVSEKRHLTNLHRILAPTSPLNRVALDSVRLFLAIYHYSLRLYLLWRYGRMNRLTLSRLLDAFLRGRRGLQSHF